MKGFKFKLQSVLETKEKKLTDCQLEFSLTKNKLIKEKEKLNSFIHSLKQNISSLELVLNSEKLDSMSIFSHQSYIDKLKADINQQNNLIKQVEIELEEKNKKMIEALKEKTMLEKLKEKALIEFKTSLEKKDLIHIDELATNRHRLIRG